MRRIALALVLGALGLGQAAWAGGQRTIRSAAYGVQVTCPAGWDVRPTDQDFLDPSPHVQGAHHGLELVSPGPRMARAVLAVNPGPHESLAQFKKRIVARFKSVGTPLKLAAARQSRLGGATAYELTFAAGGGRTRVVAWFHGGRRYTLMTMEPGTPNAKKNAADIDAVIASVHLFKADPSATATGFVVPLPPGAVLPAGTRVDTLQLAGGTPLKLKPHEALAFIFVTEVKTLRMELGHFHTVAELVKGVKTRAGLKGLSLDPATDKAYRYTLTHAGKKYRLKAVPQRPGLGGWLLVGDDDNADIYFNPHGAASTKDEKIGAYGTSGGFLR